ncbi:MAG: DUF3793 family protein [Lachnospiraceae bacterium]|nr:DUF3793 family protein [Lachnospiraceae bacterium]
MGRDIYLKLNCNDVRHMFVFQCAPVMSGNKISNLLIVNRKNYECVKKIIKNTKLNMFVFSEKNGRISLLVYNREMLAKHLIKRENAYFLEKMGYIGQDLLYVLYELSARYSDYLHNNGEFPHEMGIVLGYPVGDVYGFMNHKGEDYLFSGYWKVYTNPSHAKNMFGVYDRVTQEMLQKLIGGVPVEKLVNIA